MILWHYAITHDPMRELMSSSWLHCPHAYNSIMAGRIFMKFSTDFVPLKDTPKKLFLVFYNW
jgi:hypothetical protein